MDDFKFHEHPPESRGMESNAYSKGFVSGMLTEKRGGTTAGGSTNPFTLIEDFNTNTPPDPSVGFILGLIGNPVPKLDDSPLTSDPRHEIFAAGDYTAWIQVNISAVNDNYHPQIDDSEILIEAAGANPDRVDFKIEWEDEDDKVSGAFFIRIADFTVAMVPGSAPPQNTITSVDQYLSASYRGLVLSGGDPDDYVVPQ